MFTYSDACSVGMGLILSATSFIIGVFYANQVYDYRVLFSRDSTQADFDRALKHYQLVFKTPFPILVGLAVVAAIGLVGHLIRIYKPKPDLRNFEYGSLGLYFFGVCVCLSNVKTGVIASVTHEWGEVGENQGLAVLASSNIILILFFIGVIMLQGGLWYTRWEHQVRLKQFYEAEARENAEKKKKESRKAQESQKPLNADSEKIKGTSLDSEKMKSASLAAEKIKGASLDAEKIKGASLDAEKIKNASSSEKVKVDSKTHKAGETFEKKVKPVVKKHKDDISSRVKSRRTKKKE